MEDFHPCHAALLAYKRQPQYYCLSPHIEKRLERIMSWCYAQLYEEKDFPIYTTTHLETFWYKGYMLTPHGALRFDRQEWYAKLAGAQSIIRAPACRLSLTTPQACFTNWMQYGIEPHRILGQALCEQWFEPVPPPLMPLRQALRERQEASWSPQPPRTHGVPSAGSSRTAELRTPTPLPRHRPGYVYILLAQGSGRMKIGRSRSGTARIDALATASPYPLLLLRTIATSDAVALESTLHQQYAAYRRHGEWFELPPEVLGKLLQADFGEV